MNSSVLPYFCFPGGRRWISYYLKQKQPSSVHLLSLSESPSTAQLDYMMDFTSSVVLFHGIHQSLENISGANTLSVHEFLKLTECNTSALSLYTLIRLYWAFVFHHFVAELNKIDI